MVTATVITISWPSVSRRYNLYLIEEGLYKLVFSSQQPLAKTFRKHCCSVMFPHIRKQLIDKMKEAIEEKEVALALLKDELQDCNNQLAMISGDFYKSQKQMAKSQREISKLKKNTADLHPSWRTHRLSGLRKLGHNSGSTYHKGKAVSELGLMSSLDKQERVRFKVYQS